MKVSYALLGQFGSTVAVVSELIDQKPLFRPGIEAESQVAENRAENI